MRGRGEFAEWAEVHSEFYGTPRKYLDGEMAKGMSVFLDIDVRGGVQVMERYPLAVSIFVITPSFKVLEERLRNRKSETEETLDRRLANALGEMEYISRYTYVVVNDTIDGAVSRMAAIVGAERLKRERILVGTTWRQLLGLEAKGV